MRRCALTHARAHRPFQRNAYALDYLAAKDLVARLHVGQAQVR